MHIQMCVYNLPRYLHVPVTSTTRFIFVLSFSLGNRWKRPLTCEWVWSWDGVRFVVGSAAVAMGTTIRLGDDWLRKRPTLGVVSIAILIWTDLQLKKQRNFSHKIAAITRQKMCCKLYSLGRFTHIIPVRDLICFLHLAQSMREREREREK